MGNISKSSQHDKLCISVAISEGRFYQSTESKPEIFTWLYQTENMPIVFVFAYWSKNGITNQNQMKTDIAVKICDF